MREWLKTFWLLIVFIFIVLILWIANAIIPSGFVEWLGFSKDDPRAQFGGAFNAVSSLFSGLAFAFLAYTVWQQHKEFQLQRQILEAQQRDLEAQATHLKTQADHLEKQLELFREQLNLVKEDQVLRKEELQFEKSKSLPNFSYNESWSQAVFSIDSKVWEYRLNLTNMGSKILFVKPKVTPTPKQPHHFLDPNNIDSWDHEQRYILTAGYTKEEEPEKVVFSLHYKDSESQNIEDKWELTRDRETNTTKIVKLKTK